MRRADDALAWEAIRATPPGDEAVVLLLRASELPPEAAGLDVRLAGDDYDEVVRLIASSDKVVAW